jgi:putative intracellular protease/amidase
MKKAVLTIILFVPILLFAQKNNSSKKILMVVSSYGKDMGETRPGYEFDEFSQAYIIFNNNNLIIDIASPTGGKVTPDKFNEDKAYNKTITDNKEVMTLLKNTKSTADINPEDYDAIYIVGGKGAMFDLPYDPSLQDIILNLYNRQETIISSVCHGPASFVNVKNDDGYIIKGIELTSFCNIEEDLFGKKWVQEFPFKLEDKLKSRGATFTQTDFMLSNVSVSGKFITGQNPFSTTKSAEEVVKALGIKPVERKYYADESSVYLIQDLLDGKKTNDWAKEELKVNLSNYDIQIIAIYGYYKILATNDDRDDLVKGIELVELTTPHFFNENLQFLLAKTYISLEKEGKAKEILNELVAKDLLRENAEELLSTLN